MAASCSALIGWSLPIYSVPRPRWLCVASGTSSRIRSTSSWSKPASSSRSVARPRTRPCAHGHALIPVASTPTIRRTRVSDAAAIPMIEIISWVASPVTGVRRSSGYRAAIRTSARPAAWRATMCRATCSARTSTRNASLMTTSSIASSKSSGNRDMCTPFCAGSRSTVQSMSAEISFSTPPQRSRIAFETPWTPARDRPSRTSGSDACRSSRRWPDSVIEDRLVSPRLVGPSDAFPRLVSLAAHDLRTPLATIHGFAQTLVRMGDLGEPKQRYLEMIDAAALQLAELLDELGIAARIEDGRYEPNLQPADTLELARTAAAELGEERVVVLGEGTEVKVDREATQRAVAALAQAALRHGGLEQVDLRVNGPTLVISPVTP